MPMFTEELKSFAQCQFKGVRRGYRYNCFGYCLFNFFTVLLKHTILTASNVHVCPQCRLCTSERWC